VNTPQNLDEVNPIDRLSGGVSAMVIYDTHDAAGSKQRDRSGACKGMRNDDGDTRIPADRDGGGRGFRLAGPATWDGVNGILKTLSAKKH